MTINQHRTRMMMIHVIIFFFHLLNYRIPVNFAVKKIVKRNKLKVVIEKKERKNLCHKIIHTHIHIIVNITSSLRPYHNSDDNQLLYQLD